MRLVDHLIAFDAQEKTGSVRSVIQSDKPYWHAVNRFRHHWLLEIMAQSAATVCGALQSDSSAAPRPGFLLSIREWTLLKRPPLVPGDDVLADVRIEATMDAVSQASITLNFQGETVARSLMSFYQEALREELS